MESESIALPLGDTPVMSADIRFDRISEGRNPTKSGACFPPFHDVYWSQSCVLMGYAFGCFIGVYQ